MSQLAMEKFRELITFYPNPGRKWGRIGESMAKEIGKHFLNISLSFLVGFLYNPLWKKTGGLHLQDLDLVYFLSVWEQQF